MYRISDRASSYSTALSCWSPRHLRAKLPAANHPNDHRCGLPDFFRCGDSGVPRFDFTNAPEPSEGDGLSSKREIQRRINSSLKQSVFPISDGAFLKHVPELQCRTFLN